MQTVRKTMQRLGWPVERMTDGQIKCEIYRRWFACRKEDLAEEAPLSVASAQGIVISLAAEGNLDALCWSADDKIPLEDVADQQEQAMYLRPQAEQDYPQPERRRAQREPARELVGWRSLADGEQGSTGWLVDRSTYGIAFIAQADQAPPAGAEITPSIHTRTKEVVDLGRGTVVRTEPLNPGLTLVCVQFAG